MRIAILEDDKPTADIMTLWLQSAGHSVHHFSTGQSLISALKRDTFDLCILDWMLPDINGDEVLKWIREHLGWGIPVFFITSRDSKEDIVAGLARGADDYMVKPISAKELLARIDTVARRFKLTGAEESIVENGPYRFDLKSRILTINGEAVHLTQKEYDLAVFLFRNIGRLLSRDHILEAVWAKSAKVTTRTVDIHMSRLRKKLGLVEENGWRLSAVYHHGYRLEHSSSDD